MPLLKEYIIKLLTETNQIINPSKEDIAVALDWIMENQGKQYVFNIWEDVSIYVSQDHGMVWIKYSQLPFVEEAFFIEPQYHDLNLSMQSSIKNLIDSLYLIIQDFINVRNFKMAMEEFLQKNNFHRLSSSVSFQNFFRDNNGNYLRFAGYELQMWRRDGRPAREIYPTQNNGFLKNPIELMKQVEKIYNER